MRLVFPMQLCAAFALFGAALAFARPAPPSAELPPTAPVAVIYFTDAAPARQEHTAAVRHILAQARDNLQLNLREHALAQESELAASVDKIADEEVGLIIIVDPHDRASLMKLPGMYPDVHFSV